MRRLPSTDGIEVAVYDWDGHGPPALFVHATGFCAAVWEPLAAHLSPRLHGFGIDLRGHGQTALPGGAEGIWQGFTDDVLAAVGGLGPPGGLVGIGHSSGGAALLMAEADRPGTFAALWCFEPIVWPDRDAGRERAERIAGGARRRRDRFASRDEAYDNFAAKPPFSTLAPEALRAYVDGAFAEQPDGSVTLRCPRDVEADIYLRALDDDRFGRLPEVRCPTVIAAGARTDAIGPDLAGPLVDALPEARLRVFDGLSHFGPLEDPAGIAAAIAQDLA